MGTSKAQGQQRVRAGIYEELLGVIIVLQKDFMSFHCRFDFGELSRLHMGILGVLSRYGPMPASALAERMHTARPQMTGLLDRLQAVGLVERTADPGDRRVTTIAMTPAGQGALAQGLELAHRELASRLGKLADRELDEFSAALRTLQKVLGRL
jgi:DNA-binding MarR family transcriptional regulator